MFAFLPMIFEAIMKMFSSGSTVESVAGAVAEPFINPWKMALRLGLIVIVVGIIGWVWWDISHLKSELAVEKANNSTLITANQSQQNAINECTNNTKKLKTDSDAWGKQAKAKQAIAEKKAQSNFANAKKILGSKPVKGQSDYEASNALINSFIPEKTN